MPIIDLHTDTLTKAKSLDSLYSDLDNHIDILRLKEGGYSLWTAACFLMMPEGELKSRALGYFNRLDQAIAKHSDILVPYTTYEEYEKNKAQGLVTVLKSIEEGEIIEGKLDNLKKFYRLGVRMMTLTWNYPNSLAWPNYPRPDINKPEETFGLTELGKKVVSEMDRLGIILDVSHLGDKSFYDAIEIYKRPLIASHSNARAINPSVRNLTDEMISIIAKSGGVIGLNLCEYFVKTTSDDYIGDLVKHLNHIRKIGGVECVALGSDFDGIKTPPLITDCTKWSLLLDRLALEGWSEEDIAKLTHRNFERVLKAL